MAPRAFAARIIVAAAAIFAAAPGGFPADLSASLPGINPDMLSGGVYSSLSEAISALPPTAKETVFPGAAGLPTILDPRIGANVAVGSDPSVLPPVGTNQAEPHIARSAIDPDFLVGTFQEGRFPTDGGARGTGYGVTHDGGLTWTRALIPKLTMLDGGPYFRATDPVAGIDREGNIYINTLVALDTVFGLGANVLCKSTDGGATFAPPIVIFQPANSQTFPDKNWMVVNDYPGTFSTGRILATWTNFTSTSSGQSTGNNLVSRTSDNGGTSWSTLVNVTAVGTSKQASQPMFFSDGTAGMAYITFLDPNNVLSFRIQYQTSADGGRTWPGPERAVATATGWDDPVLRDGAFIISATNARTTGRIVIAATVIVGGGPKIVCYTSTNRGVTWSGPFVASDNASTTSVFNPAIAVSDDGQTVSVIYYERSSDFATRFFVNIKAAHSFDGGATWGPSVRVTDVATDVRLAQSTGRGYMLGDYQGLSTPAGPDAPPVALWIDTRTGNADPFSARVVPAQAADYAAWRRAQMPTSANTNSSISAVDADPDNDGLPNGIEYSLATDPMAADLATPFGYKREIGPNGPELALSHPLRAALADVQLAWDSSPDGAVWTPTPPRTETSTAIRGGSATLVTSTHPLAGDPGARFRLRAVVGGTPAPSSRWFAQSSGSRLVNVSTRGLAGSGEQILIGGFYLEGSPLKGLLVRGAGPSLSTKGVDSPLSDPQLELFAAGTNLPFAFNDDWENPDGSAIAAAALKVGAFAFDSGSKDAALLSTPGTGGFTAQVKGVGGANGVALVEIYDASAEITAERLVNLSTRGYVDTGEGILIAGFFIEGTEPKLVLVRAVGPTLADYDVNAPLADPRLQIFRAGEVVPVAMIDDWGDAINPGIASDAALVSGAFPLPNGSRDASFMLQLPPGGYTAQVSGVGGLTGVALVEVYEVN